MRKIRVIHWIRRDLPLVHVNEIYGNGPCDVEWAGVTAITFAKDGRPKQLVISVTDKFKVLKKNLKIAILAHEIGHIDLGHCNRTTEENAKIKQSRINGGILGIKQEVDADTYAVKTIPSVKDGLIEFLNMLLIDLEKYSGTFFYYAANKEYRARLDNLSTL